MLSNSHHAAERRSRGRTAVGTGLAALALAVALLGAQASVSRGVLVPVGGGGGGSTGSAPPCPTVPPATWTTPPRVLIHTTGLTDAGVADDQLPKLLIQAEDAVGQLNDIGASSADVASVSTTTKPYAYESMTFGDSVPTIHVGFVSPDTIKADNNGDGAGGLTSQMYMAGCSPTVTIDFSTASSKTWSFSSPFEQGVAYYDAGDKSTGKSDPGTWFRPSFLHEMLHAFGLQHTNTAYAMMNHRGDNDPAGGFPWGNRADADAVRPLPDDVRLLRAAYPASGARWDVDALDTWYGVTATSKGGAANQGALCKPSLGYAFVDSELADGACGTGGPDGASTNTCSGDSLYTRYALNNYSTGSVRVTQSLWLSSDDTWDGNDIASTTTHTDDLAVTTSKLAEAKWTIPSMSGTNLHAIVHLFSEHINADGSVDPDSLHIAWMPLRGTIDVTRLCATPSSTTSATPPTVKEVPVRSPGPTA
jgi:hypothetical protein